MEKYGGLYLYAIDIEKKYSIYDKGINYIKRNIYALIGNPYHPDGTSSDDEYFFIHGDLFERILGPGQNSDNY